MYSAHRGAVRNLIVGELHCPKECVCASVAARQAENKGKEKERKGKGKKRKELFHLIEIFKKCCVKEYLKKENFVLLTRRKHFTVY